MRIMIKGVVSAAALLIAVSAAHAQTDERPKAEGRQQGGEQKQMERGADKQPDAKPAPAQAGEKRDEKSAQQAPAQEKRDDKSAQQAPAQEKRDDKSAQQAPAQEKRAAPQQGQSGKPDDNRSAQDKPDRDNRQGAGAPDRKDGPNQASRPDGKSERSKISVSAEQRPRYRDAIKRHSNIKRYNRSDVNFTISMGSRIPDSFVFYDAPPEFYEIDADFREYKIIVLDDVILVIDPDTREIVEVISI